MANWDLYDEITTPADDDTFLEHDVSETTVGKKMKKITWANIKATLKTYFDTLYLTITNKAAGTDADTGTDDSKYLTSKAVKDSHNVPSVAPGTSGNVLTSNGTDWTSAAPGTTIESITVDTTPGSDVTAYGEKGVFNANEAQAFGDACFINADGQMQIGDADAIVSAVIVAMAIDSISANADGLYLFRGIARNDAWNWTVGGLIYLSVTGTTGNTMTQTAPSDTDDCIVVLGVATHADRMLFNPQLVIVEHV